MGTNVATQALREINCELHLACVTNGQTKVCVKIGHDHHVIRSLFPLMPECECLCVLYAKLGFRAYLRQHFLVYYYYAKDLSGIVLFCAFFRLCTNSP